MQMSKDNIISRYAIIDKKKLWYPKGTPQHHLFLNLFYPNDDIYIKGYDRISSVDESTAHDLYYKGRKIIIYFDDQTDEFVIPVSETSCNRCRTINEVQSILSQSFDLLIDSELEKIKGFKWNNNQE